MTVIETTPEMDSQMIKFIEDNPDLGTRDEGLRSRLMLSENCAKAVCNVLEAGGVVREGSNLSDSLGLDTPQSLAAALLELGIGSKTVLFDPKDIERLEDSVEIIFFFGAGE